ncbi:methyltransferase family protein [Haloplanus sp. GCM10025708]|uniref:methyltransferase family protein n=1 Tax=Haloferacaceae TaxID=1644056 RepID=UPI00360F7748
MTPTRLAFGAGLLSAAGVYVLVLGTLSTDHEWWPPGDRTPAYYCHWTLVAVFDVSLVATAVLDWGEWGLFSPVALAGGGVLVCLGTAVFVWGARTMRSAETMGVTGDLYTEGPYAYTRNPQYLGMIVGVTGFAVVADSALVAALAAAHVGWVLLLPRAEEPHLRAEFGDAYDRYAARVPRFVGLRTIRRAVASSES